MRAKPPNQAQYLNLRLNRQSRKFELEVAARSRLLPVPLLPLAPYCRRRQLPSRPGHLQLQPILLLRALNFGPVVPVW